MSVYDDIDKLSIPEQINTSADMLALIFRYVEIFAHLQMVLGQAELKPDEQARLLQLQNAFIKFCTQTIPKDDERIKDKEKQ